MTQPHFGKKFLNLRATLRPLLTACCCSLIRKIKFENKQHTISVCNLAKIQIFQISKNLKFNRAIKIIWKYENLPWFSFCHSDKSNWTDYIRCLSKWFNVNEGEILQESKKLIIHFKVNNKIHHKDRFNEINSFYVSYAEEMGILFHTYTGLSFERSPMHKVLWK